LTPIGPYWRCFGGAFFLGIELRECLLLCVAKKHPTGVTLCRKYTIDNS
jgi:hypothetical protein